MKERRELDEAIAEDYRTVIRAMDRVILPILVDRDVTMAQFKGLIALDGAGPEGISITAFGAELSIGQPSASLLVDQLAHRGRAVRRQDPADGRRVLVSITPSGRELVAELRQGRRSTFLAWVAELADSDAKALARGVSALAAVVDEPGRKQESDSPGGRSDRSRSYRPGRTGV